MTERLTTNCLSHDMGLHTVLQYLLWIAKCVGFSDPDRAVFVPFKKVVMAWSIWVSSLVFFTLQDTSHSYNLTLPVLHTPSTRQLGTLSVCISVTFSFFYFVDVKFVYVVWISYINPKVCNNVPFLVFLVQFCCFIMPQVQCVKYLFVLF